MSTLSGGYANAVHPTTPGLPCVHCGRDVNIAPYRQAAGRLAKIKPIEKWTEPRRPNPDRKSVISRVVCSDCVKAGKEKKNDD